MIGLKRIGHLQNKWRLFLDGYSMHVFSRSSELAELFVD